MALARCAAVWRLLMALARCAAVWRLLRALARCYVHMNPSIERAVQSFLLNGVTEYFASMLVCVHVSNNNSKHRRG